MATTIARVQFFVSLALHAQRSKEYIVCEEIS